MPQLIAFLAVLNIHDRTVSANLEKVTYKAAAGVEKQQQKGFTDYICGNVSKYSGVLVTLVPGTYN